MTERLNISEQPAIEQAAIDEGAVRRSLESERARLARLIAGLEHEGLDEPQADSMGESTPVSQHTADNASDTFERERDMGLLIEFRNELAEVSEALIRLGHGTYGVCQGCRKPISAERLDAVPSTRFCVPCAVNAEHDTRDVVPDDQSPGVRSRRFADFLPDDDEAAPADEQSAEEAAMRYVDETPVPSPE